MEYESQQGGIIKKFKLQGSLAGTNYVMFNPEQKLYRYGDETDILREFYRVTALNKRYKTLILTSTASSATV